jgi:hypothetical protein
MFALHSPMPPARNRGAPSFALFAQGGIEVSDSDGLEFWLALDQKTALLMRAKYCFFASLIHIIIRYPQIFQKTD